MDSRGALSTTPSHTGRDRGESPPEALQPLWRRSDEQGRRARAIWLTGVPFLASDGRSPLWATTAAAQAVHGQVAELGEATAWLARGLAQRADHAHLYGEALEVFRYLLGQGAEMPPGVGVCEDCLWVFTTARKRAAFKCPACHKRSSRPAREPWHVHVAVEQTYDAAGLPSGWTTRYLVQCVGCSALPFWSGRRDRKHCSPACRVRASRDRARATT